MPPIKKLPNSIRYLKARFSHLTKPLVWGPIGVASLVLLFAWELSVHPEWLIIEDDDDLPLNSNSITELSPEEAAIAADIDNSSVLREELETYKQLKINPLVIPTENLLGQLQGETQKKYTSEQSTTEPEQYLTDPEPEAKINNFLNQTPANPPQNLPSPEHSSLLTSPLLPSVNLLDPRNQEEKNEETVKPLKAAMDEYLDVQNKSKSSTTQNSIGNTPSSLVPSSPTSAQTQSGKENNFNSPLAPINVNITPQKPYYTDLSGSANQTNNQSNLSGSNYLPQVQSTNQNMPSLVPVVPNSLANDQNKGNGVNNWGTYNYYSNEKLLQNQQQQYNYGVNNHQVNGGGQTIPSYNQFSRNNSFYNRSYGNSWNNPFNNNNNQNR